jgi:hypothetical protein
MKILIKFFGIVNKFNPPPETSYVTLKEDGTNKTYDVGVKSETLLQNKIDQDGCEFEVIVQESVDGKVNAVINKIEPKASSTSESSEGNFDI